MFTLDHTYEEIMNTDPVGRAIGNLFPTCWRDRISPEHAGHTMRRIAQEDKMEFGDPFVSDAFVECANLLMETAENRRFLFVPLWDEKFALNPCQKDGNPIPDGDLNAAAGVSLFTGNPEVDNAAFAHTAVPDSVPPYDTTAVSEEKRRIMHHRPAVIVCPGGGYVMHATHSEGIRLAQRLERDGGYKAFVLNYRITPNYYPLPQMDLALAIMHVRAHAETYDIDPDRILIVGSSAGGHLCASEAYLHTDLERLVLDAFRDAGACDAILKNYQGISARPNGIGLLYPVISFLSDYHEGSYLYLTNSDPHLRELLSVENHIANGYPPTYAFANADDDCVPPSNTARLDKALEAADVPHLCQSYPTGNHGIGLGYDFSCKKWSEEMLAFFEKTL